MNVKLVWRPLLKRIQFTCIAWVESSDSRDDGKGKIYRYCQKHGNLSLPYLLSILSFVWYFVYYEPPCQISCTALSSQNTTENNCIILCAKNTYALYHNVFLTGTHRLLVTNKWGLSFPTANNCQGQLKTPRSVSVETLFLSRMCPTTDTSAVIFPLQLSRHRALRIHIKHETSICLGVDFLNGQLVLTV
jgi:hypothetical protein